MKLEEALRDGTQITSVDLSEDFTFDLYEYHNEKMPYVRLVRRGVVVQQWSMTSIARSAVESFLTSQGIPGADALTALDRLYSAYKVVRNLSDASNSSK